MPNPWIEPNSCKSLAVLVESVIAPLLIEHASPVCLELDVDTSLLTPADASKTAELLQLLVTQALHEMPNGGDLTVTGCQTATGIELELADTGRSVEEREQRFPLAAASIGAALVWQDCPQGGGAVTIKFRPEFGVRRAAA